MTEQTPENMTQDPQGDVVELETEGTEVQQPAAPTTSPDVVITDDPGDAPDPNAAQGDDGSSEDTDDDPASADEAVSADNVLNEE
jgi:hypothetical protein